jgi:WD40 repeat protein
VSLSSDGSIAFTGSSDKYAKLWQTSDGKDLQSFKHKSRVNHVDVSSDGAVGFSVDALSSRIFWDLNKGDEISQMSTIERFIEFNDSVFSSDKQWFLTGSPKQKIKLWRVSDGELVGQWTAKKIRNRSSVLSVVFSKNNQLKSHTSDGVLQNWNLPPGTLL